MAFPLPRYRIYTKPQMYAAIARDVITGSTRTGSGDHLLEEKVMEQTGAPYAVCMPKARVGIFMLVRALIKPGQKVILTPYTISDVINMVICAGGIPVFADIERKTANIDPAEIERLIDPATGAVMVTHLHGYACDMERIARICREKNVLLVEDAAQAYGARCGGRFAGTIGDAGVLSFGMYKNMNAFFGGMVLTRHKDLHDRLRQEVESFSYQELGYYLAKVKSGLVSDIATWPPLFGSVTFPIFRFGYLHDIRVLTGAVAVDVNPTMKSQLPESYLRRLMPMQARLVIPQLPDVDRNTDQRIRFAKIYHEGLKDLPQLIIAPLREDRSHIYIYYVIQAPDRHALVRWMMQRGCDLAVSHHKNCAGLACFAEFHRDCPNARATANSLIYLPCYPRYSERDIQRNIQAIREYFTLHPD